MKRLTVLIRKFEDITFGEPPIHYAGGDLFDYVKEFFSDRDNQRKLIGIIQNRLFDEGGFRNGRSPHYHPIYTTPRKKYEGLPYGIYTFYETGSFFASMGVSARFDEVEFTSCEYPLNIDVIQHWGSKTPPDVDHIQKMFDEYDEEEESLGVTDEEFDNFVRDEDLRGLIIRRLKQYFNG